MKASRLEEVLDECLSAHFGGRRTIEESLSLYPDVRRELEPLLRTAIELADALSESSPRGHLQERGREEFLNSASVRRRARELTENVNLSRRLARAAWGLPQFGLVASIAFAFVAVAVAVTAYDSSSQDPRLQAGVVSPPVSPAISDLRQAQGLLRDQALHGQAVSPQVIRELTERTTELEAQVREFGALDGRSQRELQRALREQFLLLRLIMDSRPEADVAPAATRALGLTEQLAEEWGVDLPEAPEATVAGSPSAIPTQAPTRVATPSPRASASTTPTQSAEATPTPTPQITAAAPEVR